MKVWTWMLIVLIFFAPVPNAWAQNEAYPETLDEALKQIEALPWEQGKPRYSLSGSHSTIGVPGNYLLVRNEAAQRFMFLNHGFPQPDTEAVLFDPETSYQIIFSYHETGYVPVNSWGKLDPDKILERIVRLTERDNGFRLQRGLDIAKVVRWLEPPTFNKDQQSVHWVFSFTEGKEKMVNAVMLKLGRKGFERIIWVAPYSAYENSSNLVQQLITQHGFDENYRYADRQLTDRLAGFGIDSLVRVISGGKD